MDDILKQMTEMRLLDRTDDGKLRLADVDGLTDFADFLDTPENGA